MKGTVYSGFVWYLIPVNIWYSCLLEWKEIPGTSVSILYVIDCVEMRDTLCLSRNQEITILHHSAPIQNVCSILKFVISKKTNSTV